MPQSSPPHPLGGDSGYDDEVDALGEMVDDGDLWMSKDSAGFLGDSPQRGLKRSRNGQVREQSGMVDIARTMVRDAAPVSELVEKDEVVIGTEEIMRKMEDAVQKEATASEEEREESIAITTAELGQLWNQQCGTNTIEGEIGPDSDDGATKAAYLSTLLMLLHHPSTTKPSTIPQPHQGKALRLKSQPPRNASVPLPRALLDWINTHHNPFPDDFPELHMHQPSPSASKAFWDIVGADLLRGKLERVIRLLKDAGWQYAATAREDNGPRATGYRGRQLESVEEVMARLIRVLESCPAITDDDWNVAGPDWEMFRQRARHARRDLEHYASDTPSTVIPEEMNIFSQVNADERSMTAATHRAESKVPWAIYESLKMVYGVLLGGDAIADFSQDWLEGAIFLTVWWDGEENTAALDASLADMRISKFGASKSLRKSAVGRGGGTREVDVTPLVAYRRRLGDMFSSFLEAAPEIKPDSMDPIQVGLVSIIEQAAVPDAVTVVIEMLRTWSATVSEATVEVAALGRWLPQPEGRPRSNRGLMKELSSENLMVLSYGPSGQGQQNSASSGDGIDRDAVLSSYAELLAQREAFRSSDGSMEKEGWELGVSVLSRLDDPQTSQERIKTIIDQIHIGDEARVEKVLKQCQLMGFSELGRSIAEVRSPNFGLLMQQGLTH